MARTNKYASVNFNEIYEKKFSNTNKNTPLAKPNNSSSLPNNAFSKTIISNSRIQGNMLVLSRPTPKPIAIPPPPPPQKQENRHVFPKELDQEKSKTVLKKLDQEKPKVFEVESGAFRPQGRTGAGSSLAEPGLMSHGGGGSSLKTNKFVPPHLRPGFVGREENPVGPGLRGVVNRENGGVGHRQMTYGENGRPKSGGGYERMMRGGVGINGGRGHGGGRGYGGGGDVEPVYFMNRPGSAQL